MPKGLSRAGMVQPWQVRHGITAANLARYVAVEGSLKRKDFERDFLKHMKVLTGIRNPQSVANVRHQIKIGHVPGLALDDDGVLTINDDAQCLAGAGIIEAALADPSKLHRTKSMLTKKSQPKPKTAEPELPGETVTVVEPVKEEAAIDYARLADEMLREVAEILAKGDTKAVAGQLDELQRQLEATEERLYEQTQMSERLRADVRSKQNQIEALQSANAKARSDMVTLTERVRAAEANFRHANEQNNGAIEAEVAKRLRPIMAAPGTAKGS